LLLFPGFELLDKRKFEICAEFGNWKLVFCILSAVSKLRFEPIDLERDEDFSVHYSCSGHDLQN
jgi:hypothetical protein